MSKPKKIITYKQLEELGACRSQLYLFRKIFGEEALLTKDIVIANMCNFNINWAIYKLLSERDIEKHNKTLKSARKEHDKAVEAAWKEYAKAVESAQKEYDKAVEAAKEKYREIQWLSFYDLYKGE